ncbi:Uncharacterised protein [Achromobacter sp. 2789STDY5608615]|nr:Uncharacterised protein [Achromobacter sp. 2789STDY5608615]
MVPRLEVRGGRECALVIDVGVGRRAAGEAHGGGGDARAQRDGHVVGRGVGLGLGQQCIGRGGVDERDMGRGGGVAPQVLVRLAADGQRRLTSGVGVVRHGRHHRVERGRRAAGAVGGHVAAGVEVCRRAIDLDGARGVDFEGGRRGAVGMDVGAGGGAGGRAQRVGQGRDGSCVGGRLVDEREVVVGGVVGVRGGGRRHGGAKRDLVAAFQLAEYLVGSGRGVVGLHDPVVARLATVGRGQVGHRGRAVLGHARAVDVEAVQAQRLDADFRQVQADGFAVVGADLQRQGLCLGRQHLHAVEVGLFRDAVDVRQALVDFVLHRIALLLRVAAVAGLHRQLAHTLQVGVDLGRGAFGGLRQRDAVVGVARRLRQAPDVGGEAVGDGHAGRVVLGAVDAQARGQALDRGAERRLRFVEVVLRDQRQIVGIDDCGHVLAPSRERLDRTGQGAARLPT